MFHDRRRLGAIQSKFVAAGGFTPGSLANLLAWYDAAHTPQTIFSDSGITPATNGQAIKQWNDSSGHGYHLNQTSAGNEPTYKTGILNGLPVLDNSASQKSICTSAASIALGGTVCSVFCVSLQTATFNGRIVSISNSAGNADTSGTSGSASFTLYQTNLIGVETYSGGTLSTGTISSGTWNELGTIFNGANNTVYINNVAQTPVAYTATFDSTGYIGIMCTAPGQSNNPTGQMAEVVIVKGVMSGTDLTNLHSYFLSKWGV